MNSRTETGFHTLVQHLEALIADGALPPGSRLPSLRSLCSQFNVSLGTAGRSLDVLRARGLIDVRRGAGSYVRSAAAPAAADDSVKIAVFIAENNLNESYCAHALRGIQDAAVRRHCSVYLNYLSVFAKAPTDKLNEMCALCDVIVMLGEYDSMLAELPGGRPYVGVEMHRTYGGLCSTVSFDPVAAAAAACDFFRRRKCRTVRAVTIPHLPIHRHRALLFCDAWRQQGDLDILPYRNPLSDDELQLLDLDHPADGYWFSSGTVCQRLALDYRRRTGRLLAADRHVLALDGKSRIIRSYEPVNTIGADWHEIGAAAFDEALRRVRCPGSPARRIALNGRFTAYTESVFSENQESKISVSSPNPFNQKRNVRHEKTLHAD